MKKMSLIIAFALLISTLAACATALPDNTSGDPLAGAGEDFSLTAKDSKRDVIRLDNSNLQTMIGVNGSVLLVDSVNDYSEMMSILYPNGLIDAQGLDIPGIDNLEEERAKYIAEHTKAFTLDDGGHIDVGLTPFWVTLSYTSNGEYNCLFYKATVGKDNFIFPSEWGNQPCGFASDSEANIYLAYTNAGIWQIDSQSMKAKKISTDLYNGKHYTKIENHVDLSWVDGVYISPDAAFAVYRTNRESLEFSPDTSIWTINLQTGEERQALKPARNNDFVGFISEEHFVVGALADTRIVSINSGEIVSITFPQLPNFCIDRVNEGMLIYSSYEEGSSDTTAYISNVDLSTGELAILTELSHVRPASASFSPTGKMVAFGYVNDPMIGVVDVMLVDLVSGRKDILTELLNDSMQIQGEICSFQWTFDDKLIVSTNDANSDQSYMVEPITQ